jgi:hypothetical protein
MADPTARALIASATGAELVFLGAVQELASWTTLWQQLRDDHTPTPDGFCSARVCGMSGSGSPVVRWPCTARSLGDWAYRAHRRRTE